ncbi:MAG: GTPase-activating protein [Desulfuromonadaceae bacterium]|nr:GTPase-activating protein [Desulfuromonadaceae bacterium]
MFQLPRGNPVKENLNPGKINLPEAFAKLHVGNFTGYLRFDATVGTGIVIFANGKLISSLFKEEGRQVVAYDALTRIFNQALKGRATLNIFKLSADLALSIHALLHGEMLYRAQDLNIIDIRGLLSKVKTERMTGCLRIYTADRTALIFYRDGDPLGFFHDGSTDIEMSADTSMSVARLPGAKVDVLSTSKAALDELTDLMESANLTELWIKTRDALAAQRRRAQEEQLQNSTQQTAQRKERLLTMLKETAGQRIGKVGASLVEKEFSKAVNGKLVFKEDDFENFFSQLSIGAKLVAGPSTVKGMVNDMRRGIKPFLHS